MPGRWFSRAPSSDDVHDGHSDQASQLVDRLKAAGIEAHQRCDVLPDEVRFTMGGPWSQGAAQAFPVPERQGADIRIRMAVLVHNRDLEKAKQVVADIDSQLEAEPPTTDEELTRLSLEAGQKLGADAAGGE